MHLTHFNETSRHIGRTKLQLMSNLIRKQCFFYIYIKTQIALIIFFVLNKYRNIWSFGNMFQQFERRSLSADRRKDSRSLNFGNAIWNGTRNRLLNLIINKLIPQKKTKKNIQLQNSVKNTVNERKESYFSRTITDWNKLPDKIVNCTSADSFKLPFTDAGWVNPYFIRLFTDSCWVYPSDIRLLNDSSWFYPLKSVFYINWFMQTFHLSILRLPFWYQTSYRWFMVS